MISVSGFARGRVAASSILLGSLVASSMAAAAARGDDPPAGARADGSAKRGSDFAFRVAGYLPDYRAANFDPEAARGLTDLIVFSAEPTAEGGLDASRLRRVPWDRLRAFRDETGARLILSVGGWGRSGGFAAMTASPKARSAFVEAAAAFCAERGLEGLDLDWEHPSNRDEERAYAALLADLAEAFRPRGWTVSITMAGWQRLPAEAFESVDRAQVMAYDHDGEHATFEAAVEDVRKLRALGAPASKIVLGLPFYGRDPRQRGRVITYREVVAAAPDLDPSADVFDGHFFNGPATIARKTRHALETGLGGIMIWEIGQDAPGDKSLLRAARAEIDRAAAAAAAKPGD